MVPVWRRIQQDKLVILFAPRRLPSHRHGWTGEWWWRWWWWCDHLNSFHGSILFLTLLQMRLVQWLSVFWFDPIWVEELLSQTSGQLLLELWSETATSSIYLSVCQRWWPSAGLCTTHTLKNWCRRVYLTMEQYTFSSYTWEREWDIGRPSLVITHTIPCKA